MKCMQVSSDLVKLSLFLMCVLCMFCVGGKVQRIHPLYTTLVLEYFWCANPNWRSEKLCSKVAKTTSILLENLHCT